MASQLKEVRYEAVASDPTAVWRIATVANHKADMVQQQRGDFQKLFNGLKESMNRVEALLQRLNSQAQILDQTVGRGVSHLRPSEKTRMIEDLTQPTELEMEIAKSVEDQRQVNLNSMQGTQLRSTPEGNFNFLSPGLSVVVTGWGEDSWPCSSLASSTWDHQNPSHEPTLVKQWNSNPSKEKVLSAPNVNADLDWSIGDKQVRHFTGFGNTPMVYLLKPVIEEIQKSAEDSGDRRIAKMCLGMLKAMRSHLENKNVAYRKGIGVVCNKKGGFGVDDRWLWSTGLLWNLPPWPDLSLCEADWMAIDIEKGAAAMCLMMAAMFGGIVGQEVVQACSGKFHPVYQFFYFDSVESLPVELLESGDLKPENTRYTAQISVFGSKLRKKLEQAKIFMVGSGALGCEVLKNLALMGISCSPDGKLTVTDDDVIEQSNLSQQFLVHDWNSGPPKSTVAATIVMAINSKNYVEAQMLPKSHYCYFIRLTLEYCKFSSLDADEITKESRRRLSNSFGKIRYCLKDVSLLCASEAIKICIKRGQNYSDFVLNITSKKLKPGVPSEKGSQGVISGTNNSDSQKCNSEQIHSAKGVVSQETANRRHYLCQQIHSANSTDEHIGDCKVESSVFPLSTEDTISETRYPADNWNSCQFALSNGSPVHNNQSVPQSGLSYGDNDLSYIDWPGIDNFEEVDTLFRCDSTYGQQQLENTEELSGILSSSDANYSSDVALQPGFESSYSDYGILDDLSAFNCTHDKSLPIANPSAAVYDQLYTVVTGLKVHILDPNYVPGQKKGLYMKSVQLTEIWMGKKQKSVEYVPYGNTVVMVGLDQFITNNTTLTNEKEVDACQMRAMKFSVSLVVHVAVQYRVASDLPKLVECLKRLAKSDPLVLCTMEESGEYIIAGAGELSIEICLEDLLKTLQGKMRISLKGHLQHEYTGRNCVPLEGAGIRQELISLLKYLRLYIFFSKKPHEVFLEFDGHGQSDILIRKSKARLMKPAFTVVHDGSTKCFLLFIREAISVKDRSTAATAVEVLFHQAVVQEGRVPNVVVGHAQCGMVAAARSIADKAIPCLSIAVKQFPEYRIKIIEHSRGAGIAAILTYVLHENKLSSSSFITFGPAAYMTWDLAEFDKDFVTTVVSRNDLMPSFGKISADSLRTKVMASSWAPKTWNLAKILHEFVSLGENVLGESFKENLAQAQSRISIHRLFNSASLVKALEDKFAAKGEELSEPADILKQKGRLSLKKNVSILL